MLFLFKNEEVWRWLSHFWMALTFAAGILEALSPRTYTIVGPTAIIYVAVLSFYAGTKEFARWNELYESRRHPGEFMVIFWTIYIVGFFAYGFISDRNILSESLISTYIAVLAIFALTTKSKLEHQKQQASKISE